jgi:hypothetical protein
MLNSNSKDRLEELVKEKELILEEIKIKEEIAAATLALKTMESNKTRSRSVTVGTAFGGVTEVSMRGDGDLYLWCLLQPVEVTELIHQLASNIGCHINIQPRKDFASWRTWNYSEEELLHYRGPQVDPGLGWAPHPNDLAVSANVGAVLPPPEQQPGLKITKNKRKQNEPLAIEKNINKRKPKPTSSST